MLSRLLKLNCKVSGFSSISGSLASRVTSILKDSKTSGTFIRERVLVSPQGAKIRFSSAPETDILNFCSNDYLGLANHPEIVEQAMQLIRTRGLGICSERPTCGTLDIHKKLESTIAKFHEIEDCILYSSLLDANTGLFEALLGENDAIIFDELNHASLMNGTRLSKAKRFQYKHMSMKDLESKLKEAGSCNVKLIATEGVFSTAGDVAPLNEMREIADKYSNTYIMVDDCHATGVLGPNGKGTAHLLDAKVDIINSTLENALGGATGGYTVSSLPITEYLRQKSLPYLLNNSVASCVGASQKAFELLEKSSERRDTLLKNTHYFRTSLSAAGLSLRGHPDCPIVPIMVGDTRVVHQITEELMRRGIYVVGFVDPIIPKDTARIRVQMSASHSEKDLSRAVAQFISVAKEFQLIDRFTGEAYALRAEKNYDFRLN